MRRIGWINLAIVVFAVALDQAIKLAVVATMPLGLEGAIELTPFLALYHARNTGIAFSMFDGLGDWALIAIALVVLAAVLAIWWRTPATRRMTHVGLALIVGGAIGNLIDRSLLGYVVDYVFFHTPLFAFAIFNLADACITVGAGLVILDEFILDPLRARRARKAGSSSGGLT